MKELKDRCEINLTDENVFAFQCDLMSELERELSQFNTTAMSDYKIYLQGQKDMLRQVVEYLDVLKPLAKREGSER